jgi:hypothetical protein
MSGLSDKKQQTTQSADTGRSLSPREIAQIKKVLDNYEEAWKLVKDHQSTINNLQIAPDNLKQIAVAHYKTASTIILTSSEMLAKLHLTSDQELLGDSATLGHITARCPQILKQLNIVNMFYEALQKEQQDLNNIKAPLQALTTLNKHLQFSTLAKDFPERIVAKQVCTFLIKPIKTKEGYKVFFDTLTTLCTAIHARMKLAMPVAKDNGEYLTTLVEMIHKITEASFEITPLTTTEFEEHKKFIAKVFESKQMKQIMDKHKFLIPIIGKLEGAVITQLIKCVALQIEIAGKSPFTQPQTLTLSHSTCHFFTQARVSDTGRGGFSRTPSPEKLKTLGAQINNINQTEHHLLKPAERKTYEKETSISKIWFSDRNKKMEEILAKRVQAKTPEAKTEVAKALAALVNSHCEAARSDVWYLSALPKLEDRIAMTKSNWTAMGAQIGPYTAQMVNFILKDAVYLVLAIQESRYKPSQQDLMDIQLAIQLGKEYNGHHHRIVNQTFLKRALGELEKFTIEELAEEKQAQSFERSCSFFQGKNLDDAFIYGNEAAVEVRGLDYLSDLEEELDEEQQASSPMSTSTTAETQGDPAGLGPRLYSVSLSDEDEQTPNPNNPFSGLGK